LVLNFNYSFLDSCEVLQRKIDNIDIMNNTEDEPRSPPSSNQTRYSNLIKSTYCSTPIVNTPPSMENQLFDMRLSKIYRNSSTGSDNESSSAPSGMTRIMEFIGDSWLKNSSTESNVSKSNIFSNTKKVTIDSNKKAENKEKSCDYVANLVLQNNVEPNINKQPILNEISSTTTDNECEGNSSNYVPSSISATINETNCNVSDTLNFSINDAPPVDIRNVYVPVSQNENAGHSLKQYFCPYCKKLQTKFARHLELKHKNIPDVQKFIHFPKGNRERYKIIEKIRKYGNYLHNTDANLNTGVLITCRRTQTKFKNTVEDYVCCSYCKGFFSKRTLRMHYKKCNPAYEKGQKDQLVKGKQLMGYVHREANDIMRRKIFPSFQDDDVTRSIKYDKLLILFGNKLCNTYTLPHQYDMIRNYLRLLGRFKLAIKRINKEITDFASIFHPRYYDDVIKAVKICANYDSESQVFQTPYNATTLGTMFKKCARIQAAEYIKQEDFDGKKAVDNFMVLFDDDYSVTINKKVIEDQTNKRREKQIVLPSKSDIQMLYNYTKNICEEAMKILRKEFDFSAWKKLTEGSLILVQMFNRRRAGEIERLSIENYKNQETIDKIFNLDVFDNISEESQKQAKQFVRLTIRGKLGRTVPVLLHTFLISYIDVLLKYRSEAGVSSKNKYIFAVPRANSPKKGYMRACSVMRKFANDCGASIPTSLRGTMLRKHIATYTAMLRIEENQVADLANFMGHDKQIHKDVYRIPNGLIDMTEISRLLQAAIGDNNEENDTEKSNEENVPTNAKDDNVQTENLLITNDYICRNNNNNISIDECQPESSRKHIRPLNYDDSDDELLNSSIHLSSCKFIKNLLVLFVYIY